MIGDHGLWEMVREERREGEMVGEERKEEERMEGEKERGGKRVQ